MAALVARYSVAPYNVHYWELFNEPDTTTAADKGGAFGLHPDNYAALLQAAYPRIHALDPAARVLLGGLAYEWFSDEHPNPGPFNRDFLPGVIAAGGGAYFDYVNFHYYPQNPHFATLADKAAALRTLLAGLGVSKPLVCTEVGLTSSADPRWTAPGWPGNSEEVQARFLTRAYVEGFAGGVTSIAWFALRDWESRNPGFQVFLLTGLTRRDWSPKPAVAAYRALAREVGARPFARRLDPTALGDPALDGYAFGAAGDQTWVLWSRAADRVTARPAAGIPTAVYDLYGSALTATGGAISVGPNPVYLEYRESR